MLNKEKYKKAADVYSFAIMMYECFVWGDAYPKALFKCPGWSQCLCRKERLLLPEDALASGSASSAIHEPTTPPGVSCSVVKVQQSLS